MPPGRPRLLAALCLLLLTPLGCSRTQPSHTPTGRARAALKLEPGQARLVSGEQAEELLGDERRKLLEQLREASATAVTVVVDAPTGAVVSLSAQLKVDGDTALQRAQVFLATYQPLLDPIVRNDEYTLAANDPGCYDGSAVVLGRVVKDVPVFGSRLTFHFDADHNLQSVTNGVTSAPAEVVELDPSSIEGAVPLKELLPEGYEGTPAGTEVLVPSPQLDGLFAAQVVQWAEVPEGAKEPIPVAALVKDGIAITGKLRVTGGDRSYPAPKVAQPSYVDQDGIPLPEFITYEDLGGVPVAHLPWEHDPVEMAYRFLEEHPSLMRTFAARCQYAPSRVEEDPALPGVFFVRLGQRHGALPVFGSELVIMEDGLGNVMSVAGRTLAKIETADAPTVPLADVLTTADQLLTDGANQDPQWYDQVKEALAKPARLQLGVLPDYLQDPSARKTEQLAYQVQRGPFLVYVDAVHGDVLASESRLMAANIVRDALGTGELNYPFYVTDEIDGVPTGAVSPRNADVSPGRIGGSTGESLTATELFYVSLRWRGLNGASSDYVANTNVGLGLFTGCPNAFFDAALTQTAFFCLGLASNDVVGHEFTHGVIAHSSNLLYLDQSGAINEAYADLMGNLIFPDAIPGDWVVGENNTTGSFRDMEFPGIGHMSAFLSRSAAAGCTLVPWSCDSGFVHSNSGIINRAHVLLADGIVDSAGNQITPGIGRPKLKLLAFTTMARRLHMLSWMNEVPLATRDVCRLFVRRGMTDETGAPFTVGDCDQIDKAFDQVGLAAQFSVGWSEPVLGYRGSHTFWRNDMTWNSCPLTNVRADLLTLSGNLTADLDPTTPLPPAVTAYLGTQGIAFQVPPGAPPPPLGTTAMMVTIDWFNAFGFEPTYRPDPIIPATCTAPSNLAIRFAPGIFFDNWLVGRSGTAVTGPNPSGTWDPANCLVDHADVQLEDRDGNALVPPGQRVVHSVPWCVLNACVNFNQTARMITQPGIGSRDLSATIGWGYDAGRGPLRARLVYTVQQFNGVTCIP